MSNPTDELAHLLPVTLRSLIRLVGVEMDKSATELRLTQYGVLDFLLTNSQAVQADLANHFAKDKSGMLRQLDEMERAGWIERRMDPADRRRKNLVVTKAGADIHRKVSKLRTKVFGEALKGASDKDIATCIKVIGVMHENANRHDAK